MATKLPHAKPKRQTAKTLDGQARGKETRSDRVALRIERYAVRTLDPDNFAGGCKAFIDVIRQAGLIPDDDLESCDITFEQIKVAKRADQGVRIIVTEP